MSTTDRIDKESILAGHFLLRHLSRDQLRQLAAYTALVRHPAGTVIFQKGDPGDSMMAVVQGRVKICCHSLDGKELVLNIVRPGDLFGEIALMDGEPRTADAVALEDCALLVLERRHFMPFLEHHPDICRRLLVVVCQRLRRTSEQLEDSLFLEAPSRLARCLLRLADVFGIDVPGGAVRIDLKLSQQQLGGLVGLTRESVNKQMSEWQRAGVLSVRNSMITLLEMAVLEDLGNAE